MNDLNSSLSEDELLMIRRCVNEVANGAVLTDTEVDIRVGFSKNQLRDLLKKFRSLGW